MIGWFRPLRREAWKLVDGVHDWLRGVRRVVTDWRNWHRFMSTQAMQFGAAALGVFTALDYPAPVLLGTLGVTLVMVLIGTLIKQEEVQQ